MWLQFYNNWKSEYWHENESVSNKKQWKCMLLHSAPFHFPNPIRPHSLSHLTEEKNSQPSARCLASHNTLFSLLVACVTASGSGNGWPSSYLSPLASSFIRTASLVCTHHLKACNWQWKTQLEKSKDHFAFRVSNTCKTERLKRTSAMEKEFGWKLESEAFWNNFSFPTALETQFHSFGNNILTC